MATGYADPTVAYSDPNVSYIGVAAYLGGLLWSVASSAASASVTAEASVPTVTAAASSATVTATLAPMTPVVGQTVVIGSSSGPFRDRDGVAVDPTTVTLTVTDPTGATTVYTGAALDHPAVGVYEVEVLVDEAGYWRWRLEGSVPGSGSAVDEGWVCVVESTVGVGS